MCLAGTEARLLLLPGSLLPWSLALHAVGLLGCELRPLSGGEVNRRRSVRRTGVGAQRTKSALKRKGSFEGYSEGDAVFSSVSSLDATVQSQRRALVPEVGPWRHTDTCWSVK